MSLTTAPRISGKVPSTEREWLHFFLWELDQCRKERGQTLTSWVRVDDIFPRIPEVNEAFRDTCFSFQVFAKKYERFLERHVAYLCLHVRPPLGRSTGIIVEVKKDSVLVQAPKQLPADTAVLENGKVIKDILYCIAMDKFGGYPQWEDFRSGDKLAVGMMVTFKATDLSRGPYMVGDCPIVVDDIPATHKGTMHVPNSEQMAEDWVDIFLKVLIEHGGRPITGMDLFEDALDMGVDEHCIAQFNTTHGELVDFLERYPDQFHVTRSEDSDKLTSITIAGGDAAGSNTPSLFRPGRTRKVTFDEKDTEIQEFGAGASTGLIMTMVAKVKETMMLMATMTVMLWLMGSCLMI
eukprot:Clim_evm7s58 gene=Clim_evmTU7s58